MDGPTILVLAERGDTGLARLADLPADVQAVVADRLEAFGPAMAMAEVILYCSGGRGLLEAVWAAAPRVRWVHCRSAGVDHLLFPALVNSVVPLTNARGVFSLPLAEFVMGAVFFFARGFRRLLASQASGAWDPFDVELVEGQTMGIVGYGDIGRAVARRARAAGMRGLALRRNPGPGSDPYVEETLPPGARLDLFRRSDVVVVTLPLTPETRGLVGAAELGAMKPSAILVNIGRGPVVDEAALLRALESGRIRGAALDVFQQEPLPPGHPFYRLESVLLSPHSADHTPGWLDRALEAFLANLERFRKGEPLLNVVDKGRGY